MALEFDFTEIDDWELLHESRFQKSLSEGIALACMYVDMSCITATNWQDFYTRVFIWQTAVRPILHTQDLKGDDLRSSNVDYMITPDDVFARIGFRTNVADQPDAYFQNKIWNGLLGRATHEMTKETDDAR